MSGKKLTAKAGEAVLWMENAILQVSNLHRKVEEYAAAKKGADSILQPIVRTLTNLRQQGMIKNLGPVADQAGLLAVAAMRGSQMQRTRALRDGIASFKQMLERVIKATIAADERLQKEKASDMDATRAATAATKAEAAAVLAAAPAVPVAAAAAAAPAAKPEAAH